MFRNQSPIMRMENDRVKSEFIQKQEKEEEDKAEANRIKDGLMKKMTGRFLRRTEGTTRIKEQDDMSPLKREKNIALKSKESPLAPAAKFQTKMSLKRIDDLDNFDFNLQELGSDVDE